MVKNVVKEYESPATREEGEELFILRAHLDNLRSYICLLEKSWLDDKKNPLKYIQNMKQELEILRVFLNI